MKEKKVKDIPVLTLQCIVKLNRYRHISVPVGPRIPQTCLVAVVLFSINFFVLLLSAARFFKNPTLVGTARPFCMCFSVASNFLYDFLKFLRKLSCENISLLYSTFIKLLERFIKVLAAILSLEVLLLSLCISSNFKSSWDVNNFAVISMQINFIHNVYNKLESFWASYLRSGELIKWVAEKTNREYREIVSVM